MDIKEVAQIVIDDFCQNIVNIEHHNALQKACRDAATNDSESIKTISK
jgi:hypothetical protein